MQVLSRESLSFARKEHLSEGVFDIGLKQAREILYFESRPLQAARRCVNAQPGLTRDLDALRHADLVVPERAPGIAGGPTLSRHAAT